MKPARTYRGLVMSLTTLPPKRSDLIQADLPLRRTVIGGVFTVLETTL
jgi:hypothetical protein